jgi:hypothetical protein
MASPQSSSKRQRFVPVLLDVPRGLPGVGGTLGRVLVACAVFGALIALFQRLAPPTGGDLVETKLAYLNAHLDEYDTVFIGSSHVYRSFVPDQFDRLMAESGRPTRSFNFGVQLPNLYEDHYLLRQILARSNGRIRRVFVEYQVAMPQIDPENAFIPRSLYWHDRTATALAVERTLDLAEDVPGGLRFVVKRSDRHSALTKLAELLPDAWRIVLDHVQHYLVRQSMAGRGKDVLKGALGRTSVTPREVAEKRGYLSLEEEVAKLARRGDRENSYTRRRERFLETQPEFRRIVAALESQPVVFGDAEWMNAELFAGPDGELRPIDDLRLVKRLADDAAAAGVELVLVIMPSNTAEREVEATMERELGIPVLILNRPDRYPELYDPALRYDSGHPNEAGARAFTRILAHEMDAALKREKG